jgi:hypothetical protein
MNSASQPPGESIYLSGENKKLMARKELERILTEDANYPRHPRRLAALCRCPKHGLKRGSSTSMTPFKKAPSTGSSGKAVSW